jgi:hypothetical protein
VHTAKRTSAPSPVPISPAPIDALEQTTTFSKLAARLRAEKLGRGVSRAQRKRSLGKLDGHGVLVWVEVEVPGGSRSSASRRTACPQRSTKKGSSVEPFRSRQKALTQRAFPVMPKRAQKRH